MLRKFKVNVNEKEYMVELEELGVAANVPTTVTAPAPVVAAQTEPPVAPAPAPVQQQAVAASPAGGVTIDAPMPGNILKVMVKVGDTVDFEQPLVILEAMKMENELVAPKAGVVTAVYVTENSAIDVGQPIITIA